MAHSNVTDLVGWVTHSEVDRKYLSAYSLRSLYLYGSSYLLGFETSEEKPSTVVLRRRSPAEPWPECL